RSARIDGFEELRVDLDEADQAFADDMRKKPRTRGSKRQHLKPMRQGSGVAQRLAIFDVVMDRMIVEAHRLERGEIAVAQRARRIAEDLAHFQFVKRAQGDDAMVFWIEGFCHGPRIESSGNFPVKFCPAGFRRVRPGFRRCRSGPARCRRATRFAARPARLLQARLLPPCPVGPGSAAEPLQKLWPPSESLPPRLVDLKRPRFAAI